jgi:hypothetical protein
MSDSPAARRPTDAAVEDALRTYPLAPAPRDLLPGVLAAIAAYPRGARPPFRLSWFDLALSSFGAGMVLLGLLLWRWLMTPTGWPVLSRLIVNLQLAQLPQWAGIILLALVAALGALGMAAGLFGGSARRVDLG